MIVESTYIAIASAHKIIQKYISRLINLKKRFTICILMSVPLKFPYIIYKEVEASMM